MQGPQPRISGTRDYAGEEAVALQMARDAIEATLRLYAYAAIDPPILESSSPFLNRSGEDIRRHMYIFPDPGGREVCLRPELTIPVCRAYLRQMQTAEPPRSAAEREARLSYFGPAFRYEATTAGRYRQFYQAGAELIGASDREAADAEILAVALDALEAAGIGETAIEIGDVDIRNAFIDQLPVSERTKTRIRRVALRNQKETRFVTALSESGGATAAEPSEFGELASILASVDPAKAELLIREVFALADVRHVGERTPEEIVERLTSRTVQQAAEPISAELIDGVKALLNIRGNQASAFKAIRDHFGAFGIPTIEPVLERCDTRLRYVNAYGRNPAAIEFNAGLMRGLEYYTGFLFEIYAKGLTKIGQVCGGGRYDNLLEGLGADASIPAVGFGIGLDRLLLVLGSTETPAADERRTPDALVVAAGKTRYEDSIRVGVALREAGWAVEIDSSSRDELGALGHAANRSIAHVVFVDDAGLKKDELRVRRLDQRADRSMALKALLTYVKDEGAGPAASRRS